MTPSLCCFQQQDYRVLYDELDEVSYECILNSVLLVGVPYLVTYWQPHWRLLCTHVLCQLSSADTVYIQDSHGRKFVEEVVIEYIPKCSLSDMSCYYVSPDSPPDSPSTHLCNTPQFYVRYFQHRLLRYIWLHESNSFEKLLAYDVNVQLKTFLKEFHGYSVEQQEEKLHIYGRNTIDVAVKSYWVLFVEEILNPFYIFQICSIILWSCDEYMFYAGCILLISSISIATSLFETKKQSQTLHDMVSASNTTKISVVRSPGVFEEINACCLVPGDLIVIPPSGCIMACDAVLITGTCVVNESMLTGECVPVTKAAVPQSDEVYVPDVHKRHTLYCGTQIIQTRYYGHNKVYAVVVRTGFSTTKGELVRSILFPPPLGFKFYKDSINFILCLSVVAAAGMSYCIYLYVQMGASISRIILRSLDIITIVVPPALPVAMTIGTVYAQNRLKKSRIFCIAPPRINISGKLKLVCFDKTGTLTEDDLDFWGIIPCQEQKFLPVVTNTATINVHSPLTAVLATCHSLTRIEGELTGDPLDMKMFDAVQWVLEEPGADATKFDILTPTVVKPVGRDTYIDPTPIGMEFETPFQVPFEIGIVRQFPFTSGLQRMSVITRTLGCTHMDLYTKGAPEKISQLCQPASVPDNFHQILQEYTCSGFRVIALAFRNLDPKLTWHQAQRAKREMLECELTFLGLLIMQNTLKPETKPVIEQLQSANIRCLMVTGDNLLTAVSVARDCDMIAANEQVVIVNAHVGTIDQPPVIEMELADQIHENQEIPENDVTIIPMNDTPTHLVVSGKSWSAIRTHFPDFLKKLAVRGTVFARMSPEQKTQLVETLQEIGYVVGMCGDGANDCGALKTSHVGISLSQTEASVAAPFTSNIPNISCVPQVIREGRCALVTSFGVFRYMALYSIIQFVSVLILYSKHTNLGDTQFLYIDLMITTTVAVLMGYTGPYHRLVSRRPHGSLVSAANLISIVAQILFVLTIQILAFFYLKWQNWYKPIEPKPNEEIVVCWETTTMFCVSSFQYLILAAVFSKGPPFRRPLYTNVFFLMALITLTSLTALLLFYPPKFLASFFEIQTFPSNPLLHWEFQVGLMVLVIGHVMMAFLLERLVVDSQWLKKGARIVTRKKQPRSEYKLIERQMMTDQNWLRFGEKIYPTAIS